jgi:hypothetical protein
MRDIVPCRLLKNLFRVLIEEVKVRKAAKPFSGTFKYEETRATVPESPFLAIFAILEAAEMVALKVGFVVQTLEKVPANVKVPTKTFPGFFTTEEAAVIVPVRVFPAPLINEETRLIEAEFTLEANLIILAEGLANPVSTFPASFEIDETNVTEPDKDFLVDLARLETKETEAV